jgi:hypothetical protein
VKIRLPVTPVTASFIFLNSLRVSIIKSFISQFFKHHQKLMHLSLRSDRIQFLQIEIWCEWSSYLNELSYLLSFLLNFSIFF